MQLINKSISTANPKGRSFFLGSGYGDKGFFHPSKIIEVPDALGRTLLLVSPKEIEEIKASKPSSAPVAPKTPATAVAAKE